MGAVSSLASAVGDAVGGAVGAVGDVVGGAIDAVGDVGKSIDSAVRDVIPGGWATVGAVAAAVLTDGASLLGDSAIGAEELAAANATADPIAALNASQGWTAADTGYLADIGATQGLLSTAEANNAALANATPEPLPQSSVPAEQIAAANETSDPIAALNGQQGWTKADIPYLESIGASPEILAAAAANNAALASSISPLTAVRGLGLVNSLLGGTQTPQQAGGGQQAYNTGGARTGVDYSQLMGLLSQQPMRRNVSSLLG